MTLQVSGEPTVVAYDTQRYDDLDLPWTVELLDGELRLASAEGFHWLRSARQVHIFAEDPNAPELISVSAARPGVAHALIFRCEQNDAVLAAAAAAGSPDLQTHEHWHGTPEGWVVLSGYTPVHAAASSLPLGLRPLDPGTGLEISFEGLPIRGRVYAAGHPPRISISPAPGSASVTIGGEPAVLSADGAWVAPGWDAPGQHVVDVVPGPSASYEIAADPWSAGGWDFWDAHAGRFGENARGPWVSAEICGAIIRGPGGAVVIAAEAQPMVIALGAKWGSTPLQRRPDEVSASVGFAPEPPSFLLSASGLRRAQGRIIWLGLAPASQASRRHDPAWIAVVRAAASRRLPLERSDAVGEALWRKAKKRARRLKRSRA